jgi:hypothetical protein
MNRFYKTIAWLVISVSLFGCKSENTAVRFEVFDLYSVEEQIDTSIRYLANDTNA